jgi:hypothetical protein
MTHGMVACKQMNKFTVSTRIINECGVFQTKPFHCTSWRQKSIHRNWPSVVCGAAPCSPSTGPAGQLNIISSRSRRYYIARAKLRLDRQPRPVPYFLHGRVCPSTLCASPCIDTQHTYALCFCFSRYPWLEAMQWIFGDAPRLSQILWRLQLAISAS